MHTNRLKLAVAIAALSWGLVPSSAEARRQYNPGLKRFMQRDPPVLPTIGSSTHPDGLNSYAYVRSAPLAHSDPTGRQCAGFPPCVDCGFDYCAWPEECYATDPGWAQDRPGVGDVLHCAGKGGESNCRCYRKIAPPGGGPGGHVCFEGPGPSSQQSSLCFDAHTDIWDCCTAVAADGYCYYDLLCVCRHLREEVL